MTLEQAENDITTAGANPLKQVGSVLKEARISKNLSIEEVANSLNIGEEQLIALELGQKELLPESVFINAMIRRVSDKLGLDAKHFIEQLAKSKEINDQSVEKNDESENSENKKSRVSTEQVITKLSDLYKSNTRNVVLISIFIMGCAVILIVSSALQETTRTKSFTRPLNEKIEKENNSINENTIEKEERRKKEIEFRKRLTNFINNR